MPNKKNKNQDPKTIIPRWAGWDDYFRSTEGRENIRFMLSHCTSVVSRWAKNKYAAPSPDKNLMEAVEIAAELVTIDPDLKEFIPGDVASKMGDISAVISLVKFADEEHLAKDLRENVRTCIVLMAHGVARVEIPYTGGSDQCDPDGLEAYGLPPNGDVDSEPKKLYEGEKLEAFVQAWGINAEAFWMFCDDSGAGDGSGYWTARVVAELLPEFHGYTSEPDFHEYECENCGQELSNCECTSCFNCGERFTPESETAPGVQQKPFCDGCKKHEDEKESQAPA